jgi:hypothetical protein
MPNIELLVIKDDPAMEALPAQRLAPRFLSGFWLFEADYIAHAQLHFETDSRNTCTRHLP